MSSRKRRRSQAFQEEEIQVDIVEGESDASRSVDEDKDQAEKEREVWDAVREERYESKSSRLSKWMHDNPNNSRRAVALDYPQATFALAPVGRAIPECVSVACLWSPLMNPIQTTLQPSCQC